MRYNINGFEIKSQNVARSYKQKSIFLKNLILKERKHKKVSDYGCGKLRYIEQIKEISEEALFIDSQIQLTRIQIVHGVRTSVSTFIKERHDDCRCVEIEKYNPQPDCNFILCSNVLSSIPTMEGIKRCLSNIKQSLTNDGRALIVNQYNDVYFRNIKLRPNAIPQLFGFIITGKHGNSYYGIITPEILINLLGNNGLKISESIDKKGSFYAYCTHN